MPKAQNSDLLWAVSANNKFYSNNSPPKDKTIIAPIKETSESNQQTNQSFNNQSLKDKSILKTSTPTPEYRDSAQYDNINQKGLGGLKNNTYLQRTVTEPNTFEIAPTKKQNKTLQNKFRRS